MEAAGPERDLPPSCAPPAGPSTRCRTSPPAGMPVEALAIAQSGPAPEPTDAWSDAAVQQLHEALLRHALQALHTRGNPTLKQETLRWIFCPEAMVLTVPDAQGRPRSSVLPQPCTPFSFEQCCHICGYSPQRLRDGLAALLPAIGLADMLAQLTRESSQTLAQAAVRSDARAPLPAAADAPAQETRV